MSYLSSVLASASPVRGIDYTINPATGTRPLLLRMRLTGKSRRRSCRPVSGELDRLLAGLEARSDQVRARKDPRKKPGNPMLVPLSGDARNIVQRQPKTSELIFPYNSRSVTARFQCVRNAPGIEDLRYHDLRREGASRLFEAGFSTEEVAQVTGHRSLNVLWQVYTELYPKSLHDRYAQLQQKITRDDVAGEN